MERPRLRGRERYEARDDASGLPKVPAAERIDIDEEGKITGFFSWPSNKESGPRAFSGAGPALYVPGYSRPQAEKNDF